MGEDEIDTRMIREPTDRTHLAYAIAYSDNYFLTSDKNLISTGFHQNYKTRVFGNQNMKFM